jgi:hypothetical protein
MAVPEPAIRVGMQRGLSISTILNLFAGGKNERNAQRIIAYSGYRLYIANPGMRPDFPPANVLSVRLIILL